MYIYRVPDIYEFLHGWAANSSNYCKVNRAEIDISHMRNDSARETTSTHLDRYIIIVLNRQYVIAYGNL